MSVQKILNYVKDHARIAEIWWFWIWKYRLSPSCISKHRIL